MLRHVRPIAKADIGSDGVTMRRIVLIGDFQVRAVAALYRRFVASRTGERVTYIPFAQRGQDVARDEILQAAITVEQTGIGPTACGPDGVKLPIPFVAAPFLWPFAGEAHPRNTVSALQPTGPYPRELGDRFLNRLLAAGLAAEDALARYLDLDVVREADLDQLLATSLARQRERDDATGYCIAEVIAKRFRAEPLFLSPTHPGAPMLRVLAAQLFRRMGAEASDIERMQRTVTQVPFSATALPIHPAVARHFGLRWVARQQRYPPCDADACTFEEYALGYLRHTWNEALADGIALSRGPALAEAEARLTEGLARSPGSAPGHDALCGVLARQGRWAEAMTAGEHAVQADPTNAAYRISVAKLLRRLQRAAEAEAMLRDAVALAPRDARPRLLLAELLREQGRSEAAAAMATQALGLAPDDPRVHRVMEAVAVRV